MNHQTTLFDHLYPTFRFSRDKPLRVVELFSGIGFQAMGIELAEIPYDVVATSEIDKHAIVSYANIHSQDFNEFVEREVNEGDYDYFNNGIKKYLGNKNNFSKVFDKAIELSNNLGSITDINGSDIPIDVDIMTYSFPCTDLSKAGKQKGLDNTRSGLVYEVLRILAELKDLDNLPKVLIMENVVDLIQSKFIKQFNEIQLELENLGYMNYVETLNAKNYGIAQNRDRVFMVSILGEYNYNFPKPFELEYRLKDYLESNVDEKYYLSDKLLNFFVENSKKNEEKGNGFRFKPFNGSEISKCITTNNGSRMDDNFIEEPSILQKPRGFNQGSELEVCPSITSSSWQENNHLLIPEATDKGYSEAYEGDSVNLEHPNSKTRRGRVGKGVDNALTTSCNQGVVEADGIYTNDSSEFNRGSLDGVSRCLKANNHDAGVVEEIIIGSGQKNAFRGSVNDICSALTSAMGMGGGQTPMVTENRQLRIRKLMPRETGRLMGMNDEQIDKQLEVVSNSQAYKQAGNGIVATVIGLIVGMMYYEDELELRNIVMKNSHSWLKEKL